MSPVSDKSQQRHSNNHHAYPKSRIPWKCRGGQTKIFGNWLVIEDVSIPAHAAFHRIFGNRTPEEQLDFLDKLCNENGILKPEIYAHYKKDFDMVFNGRISRAAMSEIIRKWDLSRDTRERYAVRLAALHQVLNNKISGGIKLERYKKI